MSLPKIKSPTFSLKLPSTGKKIIYRAFTVKEEKALLIAQKSEDPNEQVRTIKQIINNCIVEPSDFNVDTMASFDIEYFFLKLRAKSVGEIVKLKVIPQEREGLPPMDVEVNIDELEPTFDENHSDMIDLGDGIKIKMKYPTFDTIEQFDTNEDPLAMFTASIQTIFQGNDTYESSDYSFDEMNSFLEDMSTPQLNALKEFFTSLPKITKTFHYTWTNPDDPKDKHEEDIVLQGLLSFLS